MRSKESTMVEEVTAAKTDEKTDLAVTRTVLAMDRTMLAWIRTSLSLIAFGFTLAKFVHDLIVRGTLQEAAPHYPRQIGIILMVLGILGLVAGTAERWWSIKNLKTDPPLPAWSASMILALILAAIGVTLMVNLLQKLQ
jgi:putative membrane protein